MNFHVTILFLLALTGITAWAGHTDQGALVQITLGCIKLLLVGFLFMELRRAHLFWKVAIVGTVVLFVTSAGLILS